MRNEEILIAVKIGSVNNDTNKSEEEKTLKDFTLLVQKDTTLKDLFYSLHYGLKKNESEKNVYEYFTRYIKQYGTICIEYNKIDANLCPVISFYDNADKSLEALGFVTGSCVLIQEDCALSKPLFHRHDNNYLLSNAENPLEFNINVRRVNVIENSVIEIIAPPQRPQKEKTSFLERLLPMIFSAGAMMGIRFFAYPSGSSSMGNAMVLMSGGMAVVGVANASVNEIFRNKKFHKDLNKWKDDYENYINNIVITKILEWQESDINYLITTYPQIQELFNRVAEIKEDIFSRSQNDNDFFRIQIGKSNEIAPLFTIENKKQENIIYDTSYSIIDNKIVITYVEFDSKKQKYTAPRENFKAKKSMDFLPSLETASENAGSKKRQSDIEKNAQYIVVNNDQNKSIPASLTDIPYLFSNKTFRYLDSKKADDKNDNKKIPPLLLDLRTSGALGVISDKSDYLKGFARHVVFELSYYHAPEDLQFVFFLDKNITEEMQSETIDNYKFLPHTNELFNELSQFVFDDESASLVFTNLLNIMNGRSKKSKNDDDNDDTNEKVTQIICVVFDDYDIKKTGFSKYLPEVPKEGEPYVNKYGITFIFLTSQKENLPKYCGNIIKLNTKQSSLRYNVLNRQTLNELSSANTTDGIIEQTTFENDYIFLDNSKDSTKNYKENFKKAYKQLSSIYYTRISENGQVPGIVTLFEALGYEKTPTNEEIEEKIKSNWGKLNGSENKLENNDITKNLCVAIGKNEHGVVTLDLHEKADGPHMLTAGTTGSGKSETIITYLINICYKFSPRDLQFLLVDMKGGGFSDRLEMLPHCVGAVTDTAGEDEGISAVYMLKRFLSALNAEIKNRKLLLKKLGVDNIDAYIKATRVIEKYRETRDDPLLKDLNNEQKKIAKNSEEIAFLAHLILVVDEFTELKRFSSESDDVDFIKEITTIARVGRTLGFHIILVSQNIEGAITDDIRVNSKARVCLKVATKEASKQMLDGRVEAAAPNMPLNGRAYLLVGTGSRFVYFQSAYTAADSNTNITKPVVIKTVPNSGEYSLFYNSSNDNKYQKDLLKQKNANEKKTTQLEFIRKVIKKIENKEDNAAFKQAEKIFLAPLPSKIVDKLVFANETQIKNEDKNRMLCKLGKFDIPIVQKQPDFYVDLLESHIAIFGLSMTGKTTFLEVLINILHKQYSEKQENIFILDFSNGLRKFIDFPLVAAYFDTSNEEYVKRMFNILEKKLSDNQNEIKSNYRDEQNPPIHTTFIIDNINAFFDESVYSNYHERFLRLCRDGLAKGISIVITASATKGLSHYLSYFKQKIAFDLPQDVYIEIFNKKVDEIGSSPCHGYANVTVKPTEITSSFQMNLPYEAQCFAPFYTEKDIEKSVSNIEDSSMRDTEKQKLIAFTEGEFGKELSKKFKNSHIKKYPIFPSELLLKSDDEKILTFENLNQDIETDSENAVTKIGLDYTDFKAISVDLNITRSVAIYGKKQFGKTNLLLLLLDNIISSLGKDKVDIGYFDDNRKGLEPVKNVFNGKYTIEYTDFAKWLLSVPDGNDKLSVFVVQNKKMFVTFKNDSRECNYFKELFEKPINNLSKNILFVFSDVPRINISIAQDFNLLVQSAFLLDNIAEFISERGQRTVFGSMDVKELKQEYARCSLGDGYYYDIEADILKKLKFIKSEHLDKKTGKKEQNNG